MSSVKIKDILYKELSDYCKLNSISVVEYVNNAIKEALTKDKYGDIPFGIVEQTKGEKITVDYVEPIEAHVEPIANGLVPIIQQINQSENIFKENENNTSKETIKPKKRRL